jgi:polysaccharide export outer membrane protein
MNIFEVLVNSGDITGEGMKDKVVVIRDENGVKRVKHLNLEDHSIFSSPWYYVRPNDIILVNVDTEKLNREANRQRVQNNIALVTGTASFLLFIIDRIFR